MRGRAGKVGDRFGRVEEEVVEVGFSDVRGQEEVVLLEVSNGDMTLTMLVEKEGVSASSCRLSCDERETVRTEFPRVERQWSPFPFEEAWLQDPGWHHSLSQ